MRSDLYDPGPACLSLLASSSIIQDSLPYAFHRFVREQKGRAIDKIVKGQDIWAGWV